MSPAVFALVLNYNGAKWLPRCLQSLLACFYPGLRVVLVDNGSTDGSVELARGLSPRLEILAHAENLGFCAGNNAGIQYAMERGAGYVALVNNDTYCEPDWLDRLVELAEAHPRIGVLGPVQLVFDGSDFNSWTLSALPHLLDELRRNDGRGAWFPVQWVEGSCLVARREVFERVGTLDPIFSSFFEEIDFCRRARLAGFQVAIVPSSRIHHYRGGSFGDPVHCQRRRFLEVRNSMIYSSTDPARSALGNLGALLRNDATHLKEALLGAGSLAVWRRANCAVAARLPGLYRKWRRDRARLGQAR